MYCSKIAGTGSYLPEKLLTNQDIEKLVETSDQWIFERTGIRSRRLAEPHQATSDLSAIAAQRAIQSAGLTPQDIDLLIVGTVTPDQTLPSAACLVQQKLGLRNIGAFDLVAACSGFVYGVSVADQFIKSGMYKNILVVGAETLSRIVNYKDRETCILFGDAAGACVISRAEEGSTSKIYSTNLHAEGNLAELLEIPAGGSAIPISEKVLAEGLNNIKMKGREVFKHAVRTMAKCGEEALLSANMKSEDVSWLIPHQANTRIIEAVANQFSFPLEKVVVEIETMGNTSSATIPVAFDIAVRDGRIQRGQNVMFVAFGAGFTSGAVLFKY